MDVAAGVLNNKKSKKKLGQEAATIAAHKCAPHHVLRLTTKIQNPKSVVSQHKSIARFDSRDQNSKFPYFHYFLASARSVNSLVQQNRKVKRDKALLYATWCSAPKALPYNEDSPASSSLCLENYSIGRRVGAFCLRVQKVELWV